MSRISVVVPCFNEEEALPVYYRAMCKVMKEMPEEEFELIFVDDGSSDKTLSILKEMNETDGRCRYLSFSRNFGKEAAIYAGLKNAGGDYVATMDVDLQDPPGLLPEMYRILTQEDYDSVATRRSTRAGEPRLRSFLSESFYKFINSISKTEIVNGARDYRLMKRRMVDAVLGMSEYNRFSKGIFEWVGFRTKWLEFQNVGRCAGQTKWSVRKLFTYSLEGITGFSVAPLSLASVVGIAGPYDPGACRADADLGRPGVRLAVAGVHHPHGQRDTALLHGNRRGISVQDLSGDEAQTHLHPEGFQRGEGR